MSQLPAESSLVALANNLDPAGDGQDVPNSRLVAVRSAISALQSAMTTAQGILATLGSAATQSSGAFDTAGAAAAALTSAETFSANASNLSSGTVNTARLGSGSANNTVFLRGDGTWASASGSSVVTGVTAANGLTLTSGTLAFSGAGYDVSGAAAAALTSAETFSANASNLSSGTVATARLATGTASGSTYLRGDGTWASLPAATVTGVTAANGLTLTSGTLAFSGAGYDVSGAAAAALTSAETFAANANNLSSGTVATARLGTGTASSSTYLRGDGSWATISGGGVVTAVTAANGLTLTSGTLAFSGSAYAHVVSSPTLGNLLQQTSGGDLADSGVASSTVSTAITQTAANTTAIATETAARVKLIIGGVVALTNAKFVNNSTASTALTSGSDNTVYTVPSGRRAMVVNLRSANASASSATMTWKIGIAGTNYQYAGATLQNAGSAGVAATSGISIILEAGESLVVNTNQPTTYADFSVVEFDNTSPLKSAKLIGLTTSEQTLYTVAAGKTALVLDTDYQLFGATSYRLGSFNPSGGTITGTLNQIPSGGTAGVLNQTQTLTWATLARPTISATVNACMSAGDFVQIISNTNVANALSWLSVIEI